MKTNFDRAYEFVAAQEGGWADHRWDRGGKTRYGISSAAHPKVDLETLTPKGARDIFEKDYWLDMRCDALSWPLCLVVFDMSVHSGVPKTAKVLQGVVGTLQDGVIGPATLRAVRGQDPRLLARMFLVARGRFLVEIWKADGKQLLSFGAGWIKRLVELGIEVGRA